MQSPLRNVRKAHGFTLQHVAAGVQVNPATLSRIERLEQIPSIELAERLANFFKGEVSKMQILYRSVNAAVEHLRALEKKGVITIKRGVARGITLHTAVKDDDSEAVGIIRALLAGEENARLRAAHWLHERGLKV